MRLRKLAERPVRGQVRGEMLRPLSAEQVEQVSGAVAYYQDQVAPEPEPPVFQEPPFPPQLNPLPQ